ncbi:unnamed protein product [Caenorhabditis brenneri]
MDGDGRAVVIRIVVSRVLSAYRRSKNPDSEDWFGLGADKVLATLGTLIITTYIVKALYKKWQNYRERRRVENGGDERDQRNRDNLIKRIEGTLQEPVHECPICLGDANFPVLTNCGHVFCCSCIIRYWKQSKSNFDQCDCAYCRCTFNKLLPIRWPTPGASDEIDEQLQKNNVDLEDYNKRFSTEKSRLESTLFQVKKFIRKNWIDIVRILVLPFCSVIYTCLSAEPRDPDEVLEFFDKLFLQVLLFAALIRWLRNYLAERRGVQ